MLSGYAVYLLYSIKLILSLDMVLSRLIVLFVIIPIAELSLLLVIGSRIGIVLTIGIVVMTGIIGAYLVKKEGIFVLTKIKNQFNEGIMPADSLLEGLLILIGGIFLITPGIITDAAGFLLIIPQSRLVIFNYSKKVVMNKMKEKGTHFSRTFYP